MRDFSTLNIGFHQANSNMAKMGAYYTDETHCKALSRFFSFPEKEDVTILEPSIGNAAAVCAVTEKVAGDNKKLFGVELNHQTVEQLRASEVEMEELLEADFLEGTKIKGSSFSFCFGNPPYQEDVTGKERLEKLFLEKVYGLLKRDGIICWVIPWGTFSEESHLRYLYSRFEILHLYKFKEYEYKKWKQVVVIGRKKTNISYRKSDFEEFCEKYRFVENLEELPFDYSGEKIDVPAGKNSEVNPFTTKEFPAEAIFEDIRAHGGNLDKVISKKLSVKRYQLVDCGNPPMPPKKDHLFTLAVSGIGQGVAGEGESLHLQRGVCKVTEVVTNEKDDKGEWVQVVTQKTSTSMIIFEQNGTFTELA